ncbi:MAG: hypothetical protein JWN75_234 [Candidatus Saccharibacteria bacterium]|nr:hypothetical protein [Candidatus Saccharibacteria bacterium]
MADKRQVKRSIRQLQYVKSWQLVVLLILVGFVAATFLRLNNIGMVERRDAVLAADKDGDAMVIQTRLYDLQRYVSSHMNADMGSIYLESQYKRDSQKIIDAASADGNPNGNIYKKAQDVCAPRFKGYSQAYLQCTLDYLAQYAPANNPTSAVTLPRADTYRHSFISPLWSPDFAGWTVLIALLIIVMIVARLIGLVALRTILKMRDR